MTEAPTPTRAYDLLTAEERSAVDDYVSYAVSRQHELRERVLGAVNKPIPGEYLRRSRNALYRPLLKAALYERIKEEAELQDVSPDRTIREHAAIAFANHADYWENIGFGELKLKDINRMSPEMQAAIKSIETKPTLYGLQVKLVLHDKAPSLKILGELQGLVAPDQPPALREYVAPTKPATALTHSDSIQAYQELLECVT